MLRESHRTKLKYWSRKKPLNSDIDFSWKCVVDSLFWQGNLSTSSGSCKTGRPGLNFGKDSPLWLIFNDINVTHVYDKIICWRERLICMSVFLEIKMYLNENNTFSLLKYLNICSLIHHFFIDSKTDVIFCPPFFYENGGEFVTCLC